jgi:hypothetical protein
MGDHRFDCEIKFRFHGKVYTFGPCWLNWSTSECDDIDQRIVDFFRESVHDAMGRFREREDASRREHEAGLRDKREREEYERLKAKYGEPCP